MAEKGVEQRGQHDVLRADVTRTMTSSAASLIAVVSRPSGNGNSGVVGILCDLLHHFLQERSRLIHLFQWFTKSQEDPFCRFEAEMIAFLIVKEMTIFSLQWHIFFLSTPLKRYQGRLAIP
jgi:hypothetical protein